MNTLVERMNRGHCCLEKSSARDLCSGCGSARRMSIRRTTMCLHWGRTGPLSWCALLLSHEVDLQSNRLLIGFFGLQVINKLTGRGAVAPLIKDSSRSIVKGVLELVQAERTGEVRAAKHMLAWWQWSLTCVLRFKKGYPGCESFSMMATQVLARSLATRDMAAIVDMTAVLGVQASIMILPMPQRPELIFILATSGPSRGAQEL